MDTKRALRTIRPRHLLSYGGDFDDIELGPLNVLIGPNASGRSNFIEAISLLHAAPNDLAAGVREGGWVGDWLWKGSKTTPVAEISATIEYPDGRFPLRYTLSFTESSQRLELIDEAIENSERNSPNEKDVYFFYRYQKGQPVINIRSKTQYFTISAVVGKNGR